MIPSTTFAFSRDSMPSGSHTRLAIPPRPHAFVSSMGLGYACEDHGLGVACASCAARAQTASTTATNGNFSIVPLFFCVHVSEKCLGCSVRELEAAKGWNIVRLHHVRRNNRLCRHLRVTVDPLAEYSRLCSSLNHIPTPTVLNTRSTIESIVLQLCSR